VTFNQLCSEIAFVEEKKHQATISDIREIVSLILNNEILLDALIDLAVEKITETKEVNMAKSKAKKTTKTKSKKTKGKK